MHTRAYDNAADPKMHRDNNDSGWINLADRTSNARYAFKTLNDDKRLSLPKIAGKNIKKVSRVRGTYVECTRVPRRVAPIFRNPLSSRFLTFITGHQTSCHKGTKNGVLRLSNIPTYLPTYLEGRPPKPGPFSTRCVIPFL